MVPSGRTLAELRTSYIATARARLALAGPVGSGATSATTSGAAASADGLAISTVVSVGVGRVGVLVLDYPSTSSTAAAVSLRDGRTGKQLWRQSMAGAFAFDVAKLGSARRPCAIVYESSIVESQAVMLDSVVALDLLTGATVWTSKPVVEVVSWTAPVELTYVNAFYPSGVLHDRSGDRLLGLIVTTTASDAAFVTTEQTVVFDGATGSMSVLGAPVIGIFPGFARPAGDVNGDGFDDWYVVGDDSVRLAVESGSDGSTLWTLGAPPAVYDVMPTPDLDGDKKPDVLVFAVDRGFSVTAYTGATGRRLWSRPTDSASVLGQTRGRTVVAVWSWDVSFAGRFGSWIRVNAIRIEAIAASTTLWSRVATLPGIWTGPDDRRQLAISVGPAGDVDGDHFGDLFVGFWHDSRVGPRSFTTIVSGGTGRIHSGRYVGVPLLGSIDGHGDDFADWTNTSSRWVITTFDGTARRTLWSASRTSTRREFPMTMAVASLDGSKSPSLVITMWDQLQTRIFAVDRHGHLSWDVVV